MSEEKILELFFYLLPAIVTGVVAYYFFNAHAKSEYNRREFMLKEEAQKHILPLRLQAYERMTLFLERIAPDTSDKNRYEALLIKHIETEFEHNLVQQIYVSDECWNVIKTSKNTSIQLIRKTTMSDKIDTADKLRTALLNTLLDTPNPSDVALIYIKREISNFWA